MGFDTLIWRTSAGASCSAPMASAGTQPVAGPADRTSNPRVAPALATSAPPPARLEAPPAHAPEPERRADASVRVLLVDDHADTLATLQRMLQKQGYEVIPAAGVAEAIRWVEQNLPPGEQPVTPFDVLVSDIGLPDGDGCALLKDLRERFGEVRAVALSGYGMDVDRRASAAAGFAVHLVKPTGVQQLADALKQVLATSPAQAPAAE